MAWPGGIATHTFRCCLRNHSTFVPQRSALLPHSGFSTTQVAEGAQVWNKHFGRGGRLPLHSGLSTLLRPHGELLEVCVLFEIPTAIQTFIKDSGLPKRLKRSKTQDARLQPLAGAGPGRGLAGRTAPRGNAPTSTTFRPVQLLPVPFCPSLCPATLKGKGKAPLPAACRRLPCAPTGSRRRTEGPASPFQPGSRQALPRLGNEDHTPFPHIFLCFEEGTANLPLGRQIPSTPLPTPSSPPSHFLPFHSFALLDAAASPT